MSKAIATETVTQIIAQLDWYKEHAEAMKKIRDKGDDIGASEANMLHAIMTTLALDNGRRAASAIEALEKLL